MKDKITFIMENEDGEEIEYSLPTINVVCSGCRGNGTHVNRNIDGNGITGSEWAEWDEEDRETYMSGGYDVTCEDCGGERVIQVIDDEHLSKEQQDVYEQWLRNERMIAQDGHMQRMESGEY